jgi:glutathione reductase (NADPH)
MVVSINLALTSDGFFELQNLPKNVALVGGGYIAVELAGIFRALGARVSLFFRQNRILRSFDHILSDVVLDEYRTMGMDLNPMTAVTKIEKMSNNQLKLSVIDKDTLVTKELDHFDNIIYAVGRKANTEFLNLESTNIVVKDNGFIKCDEFQETGVTGVYALGDVCGEEMLTPVAIAAGRRLSDRLFGGKPDSKLDYSNIPSVVFSHPTCGSVGLSEAAAVELHGKENIKVYQSKFVNMFFSMCDHKQKTHYKLVCLMPDEKVLGVHIVGLGSDEVLQGFAVAVKMGATKKDFDSTIAIHPTAAEELVTMR